jgi:putative ABC transport system permease protein
VNASSVRALTRIARRDVSRHVGRSILVVALVALPVAAMVAGIAILRTTERDPGREVTASMGSADLIAQGTSLTKLETLLPAGSTVEPMFWTESQIVLPGSRPSVSIRGVDSEGLGSGIFKLLEGRQPKGQGEVAVTADVVKVSGVGVGGTLTLDDFAPVTVVGLVENPLSLGERTIVVDPRAFQIDDPEFSTWLVRLPADADPEAVVASTYQGDGTQSVSVQSRQTSRLNGINEDSTAMVLVLGSLALVEAALVASAAFAVSIRRRQRELGLLGATGATPRQLAGTVLIEAAILGAIACAAGVVVGLAGSFGLSPFLDDLTHRRNPSIVVDGVGIVGPVAIGLLAALIAAIVPARTVARVPVLVALSGRRPPERTARRGLWLGLTMVGVSFGLTVAGANLRMDDSTGIREMLVIAGAVLGTLGFGACAPWLLERLDGVASRLPLASRIAFRDTARSRSRSSPIVTAVLASVAATITLGTITVSRNAENAGEYQPYLYPDQLIVRGAGSMSVGPDLAAAPGSIGGWNLTSLTLAAPGFWTIELPEARDASGQLVRWGNEGQYIPEVQSATAASQEALDLWRIPEAADAVAAGTIVILWDTPITLSYVDVKLDDGRGNADSVRTRRYPATAFSTGGITSAALPGAIMPQSIADALKLTPSDRQEYVVRLDHPVTQADVDAAAAFAARAPDTFIDASIGPVRPDESFRALMVALALLFAVSVTGVALALGEAESRPEQRSLLALGADPRLRRRIVASRAAVLALLAGVLAVPAGILPVWGVLTGLRMPFVVPVPEILAAVVLLPLVAVVCAWLLSRPIPDWNAFRSTTAGQ